MDIKKGFQIETPDVFVPWTVSQKELKKLLGKYGLRKVSTGFFGMPCTSLGGLDHVLCFHFDPPPNNDLGELAFHLENPSDIKYSYETLQRHFEKEFDKPTQTLPGTEGFETCIWDIDQINIAHSVTERFVPDENMRIRRDFKRRTWTVKNMIFNFWGFCGTPTTIAGKIFQPIGLLIFSIIVLIMMIVMGIYNLFRFLFSSLMRMLKRKTPQQ